MKVLYRGKETGSVSHVVVSAFVSQFQHLGEFPVSHLLHSLVKTYKLLLLLPAILLLVV